MKPFFKTGERVYVVNLNIGRNVEPSIGSASVTKVGKKYVTLDNGAYYDFSGTDGNSAVCAGSGNSYHDRQETVFRSELDALELIEKRKLLLMLKKFQSPDLSAGQLVRILNILGIQELPESPVLDKAKTLIKEYCTREFGGDAEGDFSDLRHVGIAYTETEDGRAIQVEADLVDPSIRTYVSGELKAESKYRSLSELIEKELKFLNFDALISVD